MTSVDVKYDVMVMFPSSESRYSSIWYSELGTPGADPPTDFRLKGIGLPISEILPLAIKDEATFPMLFLPVLNLQNPSHFDLSVCSPTPHNYLSGSYLNSKLQQAMPKLPVLRSTG